MPRYENGIYIGKIDWNNSVGKKISFINEDISGIFEILDYDKSKQRVHIKYNDKLFRIPTSSLTSSRISKITKRSKQRKEFKYKNGDVINNIKILSCYLFQDKRNVIKKYKYICLSCGHIDEKTENDLLRTGCPVCNHKIVDKNINSLKITHPKIYETIVDSDADLYSYGSAHKVHWKCPICNNINYTRINHLTKDKSTGCSYCGDGFSYPEKVLNNVLTFCSNSFETHKKFSWSNNREYDVFDNGIIIEIHGGQHYFKSFQTCGGKTLEEEKDNDTYKFKMAINSGEIIDYIVIKAYPENFQTIKLNILDSKLSEYYDLDKVDWDIVKEKSENSLVYEVGKLYKNNYTLQKIMSRLNISSNTVYRYLHKATDLGICNFIPDYKNTYCSHRVICKNTGQIFNSKNEAAKWCGLKGTSGISRCVRGIGKTAGSHPVTKERLMWELVC